MMLRMSDLKSIGFMIILLTGEYYKSQEDGLKIKI